MGMNVDEPSPLPNQLKVLCLVADAPVAGAWVTATLHMSGKTDFVSFHGPAGDDGTVLVTAEDILAFAQRNREFAPGDYLDPETDWTGSLTLTPLTPVTARAATKFATMFRDRLNYPETFVRDLRALIATLKPHEGQEMALTLVEADPPESGQSVKLRRRPL
jgi:hypothetical protein